MILNSWYIMVDDISKNKTLVDENVRVSRFLVQIIRETFLESFSTKDALVYSDVVKVFEKVDGCVGKIESLFSLAYAKFVETHNFTNDERRKDKFTRLLVSKILSKIKLREMGLGYSYPNILISGIQDFLLYTYSKKEFEIANHMCKSILEIVGADDDVLLVEYLKSNHAVQHIMEKVLVTLMIRFHRFNFKRIEFINVVNKRENARLYKINDQDFCELFESMFDQLMNKALNENGRLELTMVYGDEDCKKMIGIGDQYARYKAGLDFISHQSKTKK